VRDVEEKLPSLIMHWVCIYIKECLKIKIRDDINKEHLSENIESIFIEIENIKGKNKIVGVIYRPPNDRYNDYENKLKGYA
jgi:hypothetical protein